MEGLKIKSVSVGILKNISFILEKGKVGVLLGPNGAGKTTLLNAISGIIPVKKGYIYLNGKEITAVPIEERDISYIFQNLALFPHLTVYENIAFPLHIKKEENIDTKVLRILKKVDILALKDRYPLKLSGGEKQKVAIARALVTNPELLLLDEPFASLDFEMRKFIRAEFLKVIREFSLTTLIVTHDPYEAEELGNNIIKIRQGKLVHTGNNVNRIKVRSLKKVAKDIALAKFDNFSLIVPFNSGRSDHYYVEFLEEDLYISSFKPPVPTLNTLRGKIISHKENAERVHVKININGTIIKGNIPWYMWYEIDKDDVYVIIKYRGTELKGVNDGDL